MTWQNWYEYISWKILTHVWLQLTSKYIQNVDMCQRLYYLPLQGHILTSCGITHHCRHYAEFHKNDQHAVKDQVNSIDLLYIMSKECVRRGIFIGYLFLTKISILQLVHNPLNDHEYIIVQWNLSVTTTSIIKCIACDLFSNVFKWRLKVPIYSC